MDDRLLLTNEPRRLPPPQPRPGDRVRVLTGRYAGREGTFVGVHRNPGGTIQQSQTYPIVDLDARGRAAARRVHVLAVESAS